MKLENILNIAKNNISKQIKDKFGNEYNSKILRGTGHINDNNIIQTNNSYVEFDIYLDTNIGIGLYFGDVMNAIFGFEEQEDLIIFKQIQGITGYDFWKRKKVYPKGLFNINWREGMYSIMSDIFLNYGKNTSIISKQELSYNKVNDNNYDLLAKKLKLKFDEEKNMFI